MNTPNPPPPASVNPAPPTLFPKSSKGGRHIGKLPIFIAAGMVLMIVLAILYGVMARGRQQQRRDAENASAKSEDRRQANQSPEDDAAALFRNVPAHRTSVSQSPPKAVAMDNPTAQGDKAAIRDTAVLWEKARAGDYTNPHPVWTTPAEAPPIQPGQSASPVKSQAETLRETLIAQAFIQALAADPAAKLGNQASAAPAPNSPPDPGAVVANALSAMRPPAAAQPDLSGLLARSGLAGGGFPAKPHDQNQQAEKAEFQNTQVDRGYVEKAKQVPLSPFELKAGTFIAATLVSGINSDLPGEMVAQVSQDIRDTATGEHVLIPAGSKLVGSYDSKIVWGQERVITKWDRINFPDGTTFSLGGMNGVDVAGVSGFHDLYESHFWKTFGHAVALSFVSAGVQYSQQEATRHATNGAQDASSAVSVALGQNLGQVMTDYIRKDMDQQPTIEIRPGYRFNVFLAKDAILDPSKRAKPVPAAVRPTDQPNQPQVDAGHPASVAK